MTKFKHRTALSALAAVLLFLGAGAPGARADDVTWNYVGNAFSLGYVSTLAGDSLDASVTFSAPLAANLSAADLSADIVSWSIWDTFGIFSYKSSDGISTLAAATFSTDANGNIVDNHLIQFDQFVVSSHNALDESRMICVNGTCGTTDYWLPEFLNPPIGPGFAFELEISSFDPSVPTVPAADEIAQQAAADIPFEASSSPGVWSEVVPTPEPGSYFLLGTGLLGLLAAARRKQFR